MEKLFATLEKCSQTINLKICSRTTNIVRGYGKNVREPQKFVTLKNVSELFIKVANIFSEFIVREHFIKVTNIFSKFIVHEHFFKVMNIVSKFIDREFFLNSRIIF